MIDTTNVAVGSWAAFYEDLQNTRIALSHRIGVMAKQNKKEKLWLTLSPGERAVAVAMIEDFEEAKAETQRLEAMVERKLVKAMKGHPLAGFIKATPGLGLASVARLLAQIKNPSWHSAENRPRTLDELYSYCGMGVESNGIAPHRRRGTQGHWNDEARKWIILIAERCIMADGKPTKAGYSRGRSPYRDVYDEAREKYRDAVHTRPCPRCGTKREVVEGKAVKNVPADVGTPLSDNHQHARARRYVAKRILRDLWQADRDARNGHHAEHEPPRSRPKRKTKPAPIVKKRIVKPTVKRTTPRVIVRVK
jgi:hypothetical protein